MGFKESVIWILVVILILPVLSEVGHSSHLWVSKRGPQTSSIYNTWVFVRDTNGWTSCGLPESETLRVRPWCVGLEQVERFFDLDFGWSLECVIAIIQLKNWRVGNRRETDLQEVDTQTPWRVLSIQ